MRSNGVIGCKRRAHTRRAQRLAIDVPRCGALLLAIVSLWCSPPLAVEIPLSDLVWGPASPSVIEDGEVYPASYVSFETYYWDIYHERRLAKLHDYHQDAQRLAGVWQSERILTGVRLKRSSLAIGQQNVYTDADRMDGQAEVEEGAILFGTPRLRRGYRLGVSEVQLVGAVGWRDGFAGDLETLVGWGRRASLHLRGETFKSGLDLTEDIGGFRFPFYFPYRTHRFYGRVESLPSDAFRVRLWGARERSDGEGETRNGFENRPSLGRYSMGGRLDYRLAPHDRFQNAPRLLRRDGNMPGVRLTAVHNRGNVDMSMYFQGTRYLRLDDLTIADTSFRLDVVPFRWGSLFGGWQQTRVEHHGDSFFHVWPFNVWDVFAPQVYRLGDTDVELDAWYLGMGVLMEAGWLEIDVTGRFEWWHDSGVLNVLERVWILPPFFYGYERTENDVDISARYAVQIDPSVLIRPARNVSLRLSGRIAFPFGNEGGGAPPGPPGGPSSERPSEKSVHGGIIGRVELIATL